MGEIPFQWTFFGLRTLDQPRGSFYLQECPFHPSGLRRVSRSPLACRRHLTEVRPKVDLILHPYGYLRGRSRSSPTTGRRGDTVFHANLDLQRFADWNTEVTCQELSCLSL